MTDDFRFIIVPRAGVRLDPAVRWYQAKDERHTILKLEREVNASSTDVRQAIKDGEQREGPGVIGNFYTASMSKKANLRKILEGWRSKAFDEQQAATFDIASVLGKPCMISVSESTSDGTTYSNIASISPLPKGVPAPKAELPLLLYHEGDKSMFEKLPEWIRKKIETAVPEPDAEEPVYQRNDSQEITDDDIPF